MKSWIEANWLAPQNIRAITTLRSGGVSQGGFDSFNLADHVNDKIKHVQHNRQILADSLELPAKPYWLQQVHGNKVVKVDYSNHYQQADASFTDQKGWVCAILTADCLPVLLVSQDGTMIAAVHAGWRGLLSGIISHTVKALAKQNIIAWLGPAIGKECFEVGDEVKDQFVMKSAIYNVAFKQKDRQHYLLDIYQLAKLELATLGITEIYGSNFCTVTEDQRFYSYRRDGETGRMATLIWRD
ncbi:MAG: peptidoglycan editing factor PgeF [Methylococcales symbiont of Hymedesmia sp. n. MRB-2018]|nr:MAG: peptidoglycan editing factor PgeF [Methylococcales symbiont of Hymedesmia sp. n. MRB-2018]KAF3984140.1 MAG: peptidoglycan editing factor PgeF [Methylococcales symbiont of Hymedesmia sp. n. MRB-2018]